MKRILFEHNNRSYLPELEAYQQFLKEIDGVEVNVTSSPSLAERSYSDIIWRFMGTDRLKTPDRFLCHEYNSLSTPPCAVLKNSLKRFLAPKPNFRVFLNENVYKGFGFSDQISYSFRDMGISEKFFQVTNMMQPEYDFAYCGSISKSRNIQVLLEHFQQTPDAGSILLVGDPEADLFDRYCHSKNIVFTGRVDNHQVPDLLRKARWGINFMPDKYPFNRQTSTKVLEYMAVGLGVVSTRYKWIEDFNRVRQAKIFWIKNDLSNLKAEFVEKQGTQASDVSDLEWNKVITKSGIFKKILSS